MTTIGCVTEVLWLLATDWRVQNEFLTHLSNNIYECEPLLRQDFTRIAELNAQYADLPGDFSDLSLVAISERLNIAAIASIVTFWQFYTLLEAPNPVFWLPYSSFSGTTSYSKTGSIAALLAAFGCLI